MKRYYKVKGSDDEYIRTEVYYTLGGANCITGRPERRGYYIIAYPVVRTRCSEINMPIKGKKQLIVSCDRKSVAKEAEAFSYFKSHIGEFVRKYFYDYRVDLDNYIEK